MLLLLLYSIASPSAVSTLVKPKLLYLYYYDIHCSSCQTFCYQIFCSFYHFAVYKNLPHIFLRILRYMSHSFFGFSWSPNTPVDTGQKLNVHRVFSRHSGRLLNVLCTFNLPPVSTGTVSSDLIQIPNLSYKIAKRLLI